MKKKQLTTSLQVKTKIRDYVLGCIDPDAYEIKCYTDAERLQFLVKTWKKEYCFEDNIKRYNGNHFALFKNWIQGLPSAFTVDFDNGTIVELCEQWTNTKVKDGQEQKVLDNYWHLIYREVTALCKYHKVEF